MHDQTGAVLGQARITAKNIETGDTRTVDSQANGSYRFDALQPGRYTLSAHHEGFNDFQLQNLTVNASVVTSADVNLTVGGTSATVTVEAENTGINTENGQLAGVISPRQLDDVPIFTLNPVELALTVPGVQLVSQQSGFSNGVNIEVNGARPRSNNFLMDGQEINDVGIGGQAFQPQIPDIFQNETVITNVASAEYGRAGGAVVNLVTKAGTNDFHGSVFERYNGSGLNSIDGFSRKSPGFEKARYDQHQYGFTAGGPIIKDKLFAFGALFLSRYYGKETPLAIQLPDAAGYAQLQAIGGPQVALLDQYLGNGSYLANDTYFASTGVVTSLNVGPQNNCPTGCSVTTGYFQRPNATESSPDTQWMYRVDFTPTSRDTFYVRYLHDRSSLSPDFFNNGYALAGFDTEQGGPTELGAGGWTRTIGSSVVNELRASEARLGFTFSPTAATLANPAYSLPVLGISNIGVDQFADNALGFDHSGYPQGRHEELYQLQDTVSITHGRQSLRVGADIGRQIETDLVPLNTYGELDFNSGGTGITALGNFLQNQLGPSGTATRTFGNTRVDPHGWRSGVFAQDDIKLNPSLTINLGIRYDYLTNPENSLPYPAISQSNPYLYNTVLKVHNDTNNIAPRIGFAYAPAGTGFFGNGRTVLRGGFGIFYDSPFSNFVTNAASYAPNAASGLATASPDVAPNGLANATSLIATLTPDLSPTTSVLSVVSNMVNPYTYQYNLGVERSLPGSNLVAIRYVGSLGRKLYASRNYNYFAPDGSGNRLDPDRGVVEARGNFAASSYNAIQAEYTHNFSHGFQVSSNYVFSKNLDNSSEIFATGANPNTSYQANLSPQGIAQEWGPSAYDHRHFFSVTYVWSPAGFHSDAAIGNAMLGLFTRNWTISGVEQFQSGSYSTFSIVGLDTNNDSNAFNDRPLLGNRSAPLATAGIDGTFVGGTPGVYYDVATAVNGSGDLVPVGAGSVHWLVPNQPTNQNLLQEIGRNSFENPGTTVNNIALEKGIGTSYLHLERGKIVLRGELNNIGNHNDVGILDTNTLDIGSPNFLNRVNARVASPQNSVTSAAGRSLVLWAKFLF